MKSYEQELNSFFSGQVQAKSSFEGNVKLPGFTHFLTGGENQLLHPPLQKEPSCTLLSNTSEFWQRSMASALQVSSYSIRNEIPIFLRFILTYAEKYVSKFMSTSS
jgi:hypothetical protein